MENTIQSDLIRGHIDTIILKALFDGDRYGYDIVREIEQKSSGQYKLKQPTLYSCLKRLEVKGLVRAYWGAKSNGGRRKYFTLTEMGRELFIQNQSDWEYSRTIIDKLISDREYDLNAAANAATVSSENDEAHNNRINEAQEEYDAENPEDAQEEIEEADNIEESEEVYDAEETQEEYEQEEERFEDPEEEQEEQFEEDVLPPAQPEPTQEIVFSDTTAIMNELFRRQTESATISYSQKLVKEQYVAEKPKDAFSSDTYFTDFYDEEEALPPQTQERAPQEEAQVPVEQKVQEAPIQKSEPARASNEFLDYHTSTVAPMSDSAIIEREYRNILGDFANSSFETRPARKTDTENTPPPAQEKPQSVGASAVDTDTTRKWSKLTGDVREMGDNVTIRTHDNKSSKEYNNTYLYYANKLGLVHYGILFGLCILAVVFTAVFVHPIMGAGKTGDKWFYLVATLLTFALPVAAFVKYSRNPNKRKRINYGLKFSLICRIVIMIQCLVIVYLINVMVGMPASFDKEYLSTLLLPALFCLMIPISTLIFNALFKSRRFAVE